MIIKSAEYITSCVSRNDYPNNTLPEFVFMGRSNVGKSSFINALTNRKNLAYTSSKPGKTLTLNFYRINNEFYFIDVPGYGYAEKAITKRLEFGDMIEEYLNERNILKICFLIVDSRHDPTEDDVLMYEYLKHYNINLCVVATKADKLNQSETSKCKKNILNAFNGIEKENIYLVSSVSKKGIEEVQKLIESQILN